MTKIRQPIVTVAGHVDHGKTSILDKVRGSSIQETEAGGITQKISFTMMEKKTIKERSGEILDMFKVDLEIPGFLFIDTPGHAAFTNLRKRGGSLADIAVLVIDVNEGIKPQTAEVLQILKANKTPFLIALNKIDNISGWKPSETGFVFDNIDNQAINVKNDFDEKFYTLVGALNSYGFNAELFMKIKDFTKNIAVVPCSAESGEGIAEIIGMLAALSQKFLKERISVGEKGKGVILEVKKEKSINYLESILYDGSLDIKDEIIIAGFDTAVVTKIRSMEDAKPLNKGFKASKKTNAASGLRLQVVTKEEILPGMPFQVVQNDLEDIRKEFEKELEEELHTDKEGILIKAESLGSLEALMTLLRDKQIRVIKAGIGPITKKDVYTAASLPEKDKVILGFNVDLAEDVDREEAKTIKIISNPVVYKIIEDYEKWQEIKQKEIERKKLNELPRLVKVTILDFIFRNSNPAVFGVIVDGGLLKQEINLIDAKDVKVGRVKTIQHEKKNIREAEKGKEIAISVPGVNFERQLEVGRSLYSNLSETQFRKFKEHKDLLSTDEKKVLQEIAVIKRKENVTWGV
jgi:translation initiation factor 5B